MRFEEFIVHYYSFLNPVAIHNYVGAKVDASIVPYVLAQKPSIHKQGLLQITCRYFLR